MVNGIKSGSATGYASIGPSTKEVVDKLFASYKVEEQAYRGCLSLLKLADKYSAERLENACREALGASRQPSLQKYTADTRDGSRPAETVCTQQFH